MFKILFVCYGNICRSPMAEFLMKDLVREEGQENNFYIRSAATSYEEIGNPVHRGTVKVLTRMGIDCSEKRSVKLKKEDYDKYDFIVGMDDMNMRDMLRIFGGDADGKLFKLLDFTDLKRDVADPWWTGDFEQTFSDVVVGTRGLYKYIVTPR